MTGGSVNAAAGEIVLSATTSYLLPPVDKIFPRISGCCALRATMGCTGARSFRYTVNMLDLDTTLLQIIPYRRAMLKAALSVALAFVVVSITPSAHADMRGQPVCDVPADEAAILTWQIDNGSWRIVTPAGSKFPTHRTEESAIGLWKNQDPAFVCEVTVKWNFKEFTGRFYRLNRKMQQYKETPDTVYAGEEDPRVLIVGVRAHASTDRSTARQKLEIVRAPRGDGYCGLPRNERVVVTIHEIVPAWPGRPRRDKWNYLGPYEASMIHNNADNEVTAYALARWGNGWETYKPDPMMPSSPHYIFFQDADGRTTTGWETYKLDPGIKPYFSWKAFRLYRLSEPVDEERVQSYGSPPVGNVHDLMDFWYSIPSDFDCTLVTVKR